jgi:cellulose synthase/poly-beta-1,6-N-acetylglucosamine synthase-like glycosyltransferase
MVSIVVAARNEEVNIRQCILSLTRQSYDLGNFEIIVVDDHSQDRTIALANETASGVDRPQITVLSCQGESGPTGKPSAIALGIERARGEIIFCTDADCVVPKDWITSTIRCFEESVAFVAGSVTERPIGSFISQIQSLEFLGLMTTGAGLIGSGNPIICNGANIAFRKSAFREVNGYSEIHNSCDDETLMQRMVRRNVGRVVFNFDPSATITTSTPDTVLGFWNQRTRWAAKRGHYEDKSILAGLIALYCFFLIVFLSAAAALLDPILCIPLVVVLAVKLAAESIVLSSGARVFRQQVSIRHFLIAELLHVPYIVVAALVGQFSALRWKDRTLEQ